MVSASAASIKTDSVERFRPGVPEIYMVQMDGHSDS